MKAHIFSYVEIFDFWGTRERKCLCQVRHAKYGALGEQTPALSSHLEESHGGTVPHSSILNFGLFGKIVG